MYISISLFICLSSYQKFPEHELYVSVIYNPNSQLKFQFGFRDFRVPGGIKGMAREMEAEFIWWLQMFTINMPGPSNRDHEQRLHFRTITANPEFRCMVAPVCVLQASAMSYLPASVRTFTSS